MRSVTSAIIAIGGCITVGCLALVSCAFAIADTTPPSAPSGLATTPVSTTQINLSRSAPTDAGGLTSPVTPPPPGEPPPPPLVNPQDPTSYGGDPSGNSDSSTAVRAALAAGDLHILSGQLFWVNNTVSIPTNRNILCDSTSGGFKQVNFNIPIFRFSGSNTGLFDCGFRGPNYNNPFPIANQNSGDFIDVGYGGHNSNVKIIGNDFNGQAGWTGAIILYESAGGQPPVNNTEISYNTFEHCGYYAVQVTSATNTHIHHNTLNDCSGFIESDNTGQANTGNVVDHNHLSFIHGTGNSIRGGGKFYSELSCGSSCGGKACNFSGNYCHDDIIDGPYHSLLDIAAVGGSQNQAYYCNESCNGGCTATASQNQGPPCPSSHP